MVRILGRNGPAATLQCNANPLAAIAGVSAFAGCRIDTAGTFTLSASSAGLAGTDSGAITIASSKLDQAITFGALAAKYLGDADFAVSATASSGLAVAFASDTAATCTVSGSTVHLVAAGTCTLRATQADVKFLGSYPAAGDGGAQRRAEVDEATRRANDWLESLRGQIR